MILEPEFDALAEHNSLLLAARIGKDVDRGLNNPVIQLLIAKADELKEAAIATLIWETDPVKLHVARLNAQGACLIGTWINAAIEEGRKANDEVNGVDGIQADEAAGVEGHDDQDEAGDA